MAEYQKLVDDRQKQASMFHVPLPPKVDRFQLPGFVEFSVGNNPNQNGPMSQYLNDSTAAGSSSRLDGQFPKRLVSSIINDIQSKIVQIPPDLQDQAVKLIADTQAKTIMMSCHYYESLATRLLDQVFNLCDRASRAELERDMAIKEKDKARAHERSMGEHYDIVTVQVEDIFNGRLQAARNLLGKSGPVTSSTEGNPTEVQGSNSHLLRTLSTSKSRKLVSVGKTRTKRKRLMKTPFAMGDVEPPLALHTSLNLLTQRFLPDRTRTQLQHRIRARQSSPRVSSLMVMARTLTTRTCVRRLQLLVSCDRL